MSSTSSTRTIEKGQGLVEYAIIIALVAIVVIGVMRMLGPKIGCTFSGINNSLPGGGGAGDNCGDEVASEPETRSDLNCDVAIAKWYDTIGASQDSMAAAGWPNSGPVYENWIAATNEWYDSPERVYGHSAGCW